MPQGGPDSSPVPAIPGWTGRSDPVFKTMVCAFNPNTTSGGDWVERGCMQIALKNIKIMLLRQIYNVIVGSHLARVTFVTEFLREKLAKHRKE